jgi:hypothetical protein
MKEFNLELAKQGHPLVTRDGEKVVQFIHLEKPFPQDNWGAINAVFENGDFESYDICGKYQKNVCYTKDLYLDDSTDWQPPLKEGDVIEVRNYTESGWRKEVLIFIDKNNMAVCTSCLRGKELHESGIPYGTNVWRYYRRIPQKPTIEVTVKINGKEAKLSDLSEETLKKLRNLE